MLTSSRQSATGAILLYFFTCSICLADEGSFQLTERTVTTQSIVVVFSPKPSDDQRLIVVVSHNDSVVKHEKTPINSDTELAISADAPDGQSFDGGLHITAIVLNENDDSLVARLTKTLRVGAAAPPDDPAPPIHEAQDTPVEVDPSFANIDEYIQQKLDVTSSSSIPVAHDDGLFWENLKVIAAGFNSNAATFNPQFSVENKNEVTATTLEQIRNSMNENGTLEEDIASWQTFLKELIDTHVVQAVKNAPPENEETSDKYAKAWRSLAASFEQFAEDDEQRIVNKFIRDYEAGVFNTGPSPTSSPTSSRTINCFHLLFGF